MILLPHPVGDRPVKERDADQDDFKRWDDGIACDLHKGLHRCDIDKAAHEADDCACGGQYVKLEAPYQYGGHYADSDKDVSHLLRKAEIDHIIKLE